jgi:hypothetical protein
MSKVTGIGIHFGAHPPASSTLDLLLDNGKGGVEVRRLSLMDLHAYSAKVGGAEITGDDIVDALEQIAQRIAPLAAEFKRG